MNFRCKKNIVTSLMTAALLMISVITMAVQAATPTTGAEAACLIDVNTGKILYQQNPTKWMHPASTKS